MDEVVSKRDVRRRGAWHVRPSGALLRAARWIVSILVVAGLVMTRAFAPAQEVEVLLPEKECQVKYALLYSFGLLTAWPPESFEPADTGPFVIGVLGTKPFPEYLARIAASKKIQGRAIVIRHYKLPEEVKKCHILYVTSSVAKDSEQAIIRKFADQPVLLVSEPAAEGQESAAIIEFIIEQGTVKFVLDVEAAKAHHLHVDPRLLKLAKRTKSDSQK
jgi:hypothetical protein